MMSSYNKILTIEEIRDLTKGMRVVMCHGVWDVLHPGHLVHLEAAAAYGDVLVVGVTSDGWVTKAKGAAHPKFTHQQRARQLAALEIVDYVVIDHQATPVSNLRVLRPAYYVKGPDYQPGTEGAKKLAENEGPVLDEIHAELIVTKGEKYSSTSLHKGLDVGPYHKDAAGYKDLVEKTYSDVPEFKLPAEFARTFNDDTLMLMIRLARYKFLAKMLQRGDRVLEVGSGYGLGALFMSQFCAHVTGVDVQPQCVAEAKEFCRRDNVSFHQLDFLLQPWNSAGYEVVAAMDVIEHMSPVDGERLIARMVQHVLPAGMVVLGTPSVYSMPWQSKFSQLSHVHCYEKDELQEMLRKKFARVLSFSMNDEVVHTGHSKMAWYYFFLCFYPKEV
jgi:rfaE bifunctional protein nucleotidyltransferase chain/domain